MAQGVPRTRLNSAGLLQVLTELAVGDVASPRQSFAERLGEWLDFKDALALYAALNAAPVSSVTVPPSAVIRLAEDLARVRAELATTILADGPAQVGLVPLSRSAARTDTVVSGADLTAAAPFAPFHRYYLAQQRSMAAGIAPLRLRVRAALGRQSAVLQQLAALDAVLDQALMAREASLLANVPVLLGKRFARLTEAQQSARGGAAMATDFDPQTQANDWQAGFWAEMQRVLLAELDLRLMPVAGLVATLEPTPDRDSTGW